MSKSHTTQSLISLNTEGLFGPDLEMSVPPTKRSSQELRDRLQQWTTDSKKTPIFSGYRRQILASEGLKESHELAQQLRQNFSTMVVLGIGGSALGAKTALSALSWSVPTSDSRQVFIAENLDPVDFEQMWQKLDLNKTCFALVTKSGGTIETMAQASVVMDRLRKAGLPTQHHLVAVTDPNSGSLRKWVARTGVRSLSIPSDVGGRFSVLTPVGLLPLAFAGIDIQGLVDGAQKFFGGKSGVTHEQMNDLALRIWELENSGFAGHVLEPYASVLKDFGAWFVQLWGESLGKPFSGKNSWGACGAIPVAAVGATDQHSLLQLQVEGPNRLINGFIGIDHWPKYGHSTVMTQLDPEFEGLSFAFGKTFAEILDAERQATAQVLRERGRPVYELQALNCLAPSLGALFGFYMDLTSLVGAAWNIDPYIQPGVEHGKKILPMLLRQ